MDLLSLRHRINSKLANRVDFISYLFPKDKRLWVFGSWEGNLYSDNSKYIFEFVCKNHPEIHAVWITKSKSICEYVRSKGYPAYTRYSLKGIMYVLTAAVGFIISDEKRDISPFINRKLTKIIQLWHGIPAKAFAWKDDKGKNIFRGGNAERMASYYWASTSPKYSEYMSEATLAPLSHFFITGYPRNDAFYSKPRNDYFEELKTRWMGSKLIIYMPTHRNFGKEKIKTDDFLYVDKILRDNNIVMVYKPHYHELKDVIHLEKEFSNIILAKDQAIWGDPYSYLHYFDLLISDYSSIIYDFLCADKPIVLYTYDLEHYRNADAGFYDTFENVPVGPFCFTWDETLKEVISLLSSDTWRDKRKKCKDLFLSYDDGNSSRRVFEMSKDILSIS